jgi:hypothetical protein
MSESQYYLQINKWGIRKNRKGDEWRQIHYHFKERKRQGKKSVVLIDGVEQSEEKITREMARPQYRSPIGISMMTFHAFSE